MTIQSTVNSRIFLIITVRNKDETSHNDYTAALRNVSMLYKNFVGRQKSFNLLHLTEFIMRRLDGITASIMSDQLMLMEKKSEHSINKTKTLFFKDENYIKKILGSNFFFLKRSNKRTFFIYTTYNL
jgi:hypothetical protein